VEREFPAGYARDTVIRMRVRRGFMDISGRPSDRHACSRSCGGCDRRSPPRGRAKQEMIARTAGVQNRSVVQAGGGKPF
jgi:hypothetical protein